MATISLTLPSDGQTIDASDVNNPFNTIAAEVNGNLDNSNIKAGAAIERSKIAGFTDGWESLGYAPTTITALGNRSYTVLVPSVDTTSATSVGQRLKLPRTVQAPTYMGGAFNGTSHYFTKVTPTGTLSTVTNNFTIMTHVELTAYGSVQTVCGRADSTPNNGIQMRIETTGQIGLLIWNAGTANYRIVSTYQSLPINKKVHVAASWTSGTVVIYFDGVSVPVSGAGTGGTAPTVAGTGGDFSIGRAGAYNAQYFTGYISSVGFFDAVLTQATVRLHMNQALTGGETNCIGAWNLNNAATDASVAANNLTATGGVGYTLRSPYTNSVTGTSVTAGTTNYGIITAQTFSTNTTYTVQIPEGETLPTPGGIGTISYSTQARPYGFPTSPIILWHAFVASTQTPLTTLTDVYGASITLTVPAGVTLKISYRGSLQSSVAADVASLILYEDSTAINTTFSIFRNANNQENSFGQHLLSPTAGSHTYKLRAQLNAGTGTIINAASVGVMTFITIEMLGL